MEKSTGKPHKPTVAVVKFASCDGCQLTLLNCEEELLALADRIEFAHFAEASSDLRPGPYDLAIVEGSISTPKDLHRIVELRAQSKKLITIGACATAGGVQALRNFADHEEFKKAVYASPEMIESLAESSPIAQHVQVDFELRGCPVDKHQLIEVVLAMAGGRRPKTSTECVCQPCKRRGTVCVVVAQKKACLGPVTQAGCGAICPAYDRGCYACFGPASQTNMQAISEGLLLNQMSNTQAAMFLQSFHPASPEFQSESRRLGESPRRLWQLQPPSRS